MSGLIQDCKKKLISFFDEYGKVFGVGLLFFITLVLVYVLVLLTTPTKLKVSFLDVGQGDAIFVQTPSGKSMMIDGGVSNIVLSKLSSDLSYFDNDIDVMVATHPDADHITGLIPVLEKYGVKNFVTSPVVGNTKIFEDLHKHVLEEHADSYIAKTGDVIDFHDGVIAHILYPQATYHGNKNDTNDASVSVLVTYGDESFLLTGDLPSKEESKLLDAGLPKNITVYKAGHHGSKYSSGEQLLTYIKPEYAVISAGKNNSYGHPNPEAIERLQKYSKEIISTIDRGTITFVTDGRILEIKTEK
jgi:beta-lactamase superfamily II metal-dependent hydrolase